MKLCNSSNLSLVTSLDLVVNSQKVGIGNLGKFVPNLEKLKLSSSIVHSIRDLGSGLSHLTILWMSKCHLKDLQGLASLSMLKEFYAAFNQISELDSISFLENLEVLDIEGNQIHEWIQVEYLALCPKLFVLNLNGNPFIESMDVDDFQHLTNEKNCSTKALYRKAVGQLLPQLQTLDDIPMDVHVDQGKMLHSSAFTSLLAKSFYFNVSEKALVVQSQNEAHAFNQGNAACKQMTTPLPPLTCKPKDQQFTRHHHTKSIQLTPSPPKSNPKPLSNRKFRPMEPFHYVG